MSAIAPAAHAPHPAPLGPGGHAAPALAHPRAAFGAVLDSLPKADARPNGAPSDEHGRREAPQGLPNLAQSLSASLASLLPSAAEPVFAIRSTDGPKNEGLAPSPAPAGVKPSTPSEDPNIKGAVAPGGAPVVGKLVGERAFHALDPTPWEATASLAQAASEPRRSASSPAQEARPTQQATGAALSPPPEAAAPSASAEPTTHLIATTPSPRPPTPWEATASLAQAASEPRGSAPSPVQQARPTQQATGAALSPPREAAAPSASAEPATHLIATMPSPAPTPPASAAPKGFRAERQSPSASAVASAASHKPPPAPEPRSGAATDDRQPSGAEKAGADDSVAADTSQPQAQGASFGGLQPTSVVAVGTVQTGSSASLPAAAAPAPSSPRASPATPQAPPVREIDVDLSPGGLEDVSMTMRLSGDKLSLVVRAASSQTTGAIEGVREAIAQRLAAIGQPLSAFIIQQTGSTADGNASEASNQGSGDARPQSEQDLAGEGGGARRGARDF